MIKNLFRLAALVAGLLLLGTCDEWPQAIGPRPAEPGDLQVRITAGYSGTAFLFRVRGDPIDAIVRGEPDIVLFEADAQDAQGWRRMIAIDTAGRPQSGVLVKLAVPDVGRINEYEVVLDEVADANDELLPSSSHTLAIDTIR